jgi:hypothetical protein
LASRHGFSPSSNPPRSLARKGIKADAHPFPKSRRDGPAPEMEAFPSQVIDRNREILPAFLLNTTPSANPAVWFFGNTSFGPIPQRFIFPRDGHLRSLDRLGEAGNGWATTGREPCQLQAGSPRTLSITACRGEVPQERRAGRFPSRDENVPGRPGGRLALDGS